MYYKVRYHTKITRKIEDMCNIFPQILINKNPPAGQTGGLSAVTLPFLQLKLGRKVSGDSPHKNFFAGKQDLSAIFINIHIN